MTWTARGKGIYIEGDFESPPVIRDHAASDRDIDIIVQAMNTLPLHNFTIKQLQKIADQDPALVKKEVQRLLDFIQKHQP